MPTDVFISNRRIGAWKSDGAVLRFNDQPTALMVRGINVDFSRPAELIVAMNIPDAFLATGDPTGSFSFNAIIGPTANVSEFIDAFADTSRIGENQITLSAGKNPGGRFSSELIGIGSVFILIGCLLTRLNITSTKENNSVSILRGSFMGPFLNLKKEFRAAAGETPISLPI